MVLWSCLNNRYVWMLNVRVVRHSHCSKSEMLTIRGVAITSYYMSCPNISISRKSQFIAFKLAHTVRSNMSRTSLKYTTCHRGNRTLLCLPAWLSKPRYCYIASPSKLRNFSLNIFWLFYIGWLGSKNYKGTLTTARCLTPATA